MKIGDRMKINYENRARFSLTRRTPVIIRIDGRAFHTLMRGAPKPFDSKFVESMVDSARWLAEQMQGFKLAYVQSDEASFLLTDYDQIETEAWFDYNKSKIESISSSAMTAFFNQSYSPRKLAMFDARSFNIPESEIANYFLWRAKDWERNSVAMYCQAFFSHKELHGKGRADQHEMLHKIGKNWTVDLDSQLRNGTFITKDGEHHTPPEYSAINGLLESQLSKSKDSP